MSDASETESHPAPVAVVGESIPEMDFGDIGDAGIAQTTVENFEMDDYATTVLLPMRMFNKHSCSPRSHFLLHLIPRLHQNFHHQLPTSQSH